MEKVENSSGTYGLQDQLNSWQRLQLKIRERRFAFFLRLLSRLKRPLEILDVGGTQEFWETMGFRDENVSIMLYNLFKRPDTHPQFTNLSGDARDMHQFRDKQFQVVFSNSVIEHVGSYEEQKLMAQEVQRVGKRYYVQTPNRYFPIEPHVLLPFFQFFPASLQVFILTHFRSPWGWKIDNKEEAIKYVRSIRLLNEKELRALFPGARLHKERFLGLTKSLIVYDGWECEKEIKEGSLDTCIPKRGQEQRPVRVCRLLKKWDK